VCSDFLHIAINVQHGEDAIDDSTMSTATQLAGLLLYKLFHSHHISITTATCRICRLCVGSMSLIHIVEFYCDTKPCWHITHFVDWTYGLTAGKFWYTVDWYIVYLLIWYRADGWSEMTTRLRQHVSHITSGLSVCFQPKMDHFYQEFIMYILNFIINSCLNNMPAGGWLVRLYLSYDLLLCSTTHPQAIKNHPRNIIK